MLNALNARAAHFTGGRDRLGRWLIYVPVPADLQPWSKRNMELAIQYLFATMHANGNVATEGATTTPDETQFVLLVDTQKCSNRIARSTLRHIEHIVDSAPVNPDSGGSDSGLLLSIVVVRSDAFWDKQLVDNCTKAISSSGSGNGGTIGRSRRDEVRTAYPYSTARSIITTILCLNPFSADSNHTKVTTRQIFRCRTPAARGAWRQAHGRPRALAAEATGMDTIMHA